LPAGEPIQSVLEAGWNWGILFDRLEALEFNPKLANPLKTRWIAESFAKTDQIDATVHVAPYSEGENPDGSAMACINVRCLDDVDLSKLKIVPYDGASH
jgi:hypothetical protein